MLIEFLTNPRSISHSLPCNQNRLAFSGFRNGRGAPLLLPGDQYSVLNLNLNLLPHSLIANTCTQPAPALLHLADSSDFHTLLVDGAANLPMNIRALKPYRQHVQLQHQPECGFTQVERRRSNSRETLSRFCSNICHCASLTQPSWRPISVSRYRHYLHALNLNSARLVNIR
jgi:hypothetical protein